ncbi:hypothetical protein UNDYM_0073 [Undibacterium sp. YM2]|uniref:hypothetical protein n=1 Tax=Undibacterium sp. YM2 TaxID=2058625 RepID=UPI001331D612|nr:hypothetical protein [Undibacterium sp. YM2]BBB64326.1 hypothetical protein UNDYM_0073 [Undibacterium sp. YM2]
MKKITQTATSLPLTKCALDDPHQSCIEHTMRVLSQKEILRVTGGPEIEVGTGTDLQRGGYENH